MGIYIITSGHCCGLWIRGLRIMPSCKASTQNADWIVRIFFGAQFEREDLVMEV